MLTVETGGLVGGVLSSFHIAPTKRTSHHPLHGVSGFLENSKITNKIKFAYDFNYGVAIFTTTNDNYFWIYLTFWIGLQ